MRILFVWTAAEFAIYDVARGYHAALKRQGHDIRDYKLNKRFDYHARALGAERAQNISLVSRLASENVLIEAMRQSVDLVFIVSGMALHPDGVLFLSRSNIPTVTVFTESPYHDKEQLYFANVHPRMFCATQERTSAAKHNWLYLRPAYDPAVHAPTPPLASHGCDVLMVGTFFPERIKLLEQVNWAGVDARFIGTWTMPAETPTGYKLDKAPPILAPYATEQCVDNKLVPRLYSAAKINLNLYRGGLGAESINPRAVELAACGCFQLSSHRAEVVELFGDSVPTFKTAAELQDLVQYYLKRPNEREQLSRRAREIVREETFDARAQVLMSHL